MVERHNLKKQQEKEAPSSKTQEPNTVTLNVPKGVKVVINEIDNDKPKDHHRPSTSTQPKPQPSKVIVINLVTLIVLLIK